MRHLTSRISRWMPEDSKRVAVDSHPRLTGIMDTVNSTLAHGPKTQLPPEFSDPKSLEIIDKVAVEEWFAGYKESREFRETGVGSLVGDIVARMVDNVERSNHGLLDIRGGEFNSVADEAREEDIRFAMSGCHDSTLAAILSSLGAFEGENWPQFTSHLAIELFREEVPRTANPGDSVVREPSAASSTHKQSSSRLDSIFSGFRKNNGAPKRIGRKRVDDLTHEEKEKLKGFYVRLRYNDRPMFIPGCGLPGKHFAGDQSLCTLVRHFEKISSRSPANVLGRKHSNLLPINSPLRIGRSLASQT